MAELSFPFDPDDLHGAIERLEDEIEELAARRESCRKFILAARLAIVGGAIMLAALLVGAIRFDPMLMAGGAAALLGGIVVYGSNGSTAKEATAALAKAEAARAALIAQLDLRLVAERPMLH